MIKWDRRGLMGAIMGNRMEMKTRIGVILTNLEFLEFQWIWVIAWAYEISNTVRFSNYEISNTDRLSNYEI